METKNVLVFPAGTEIAFEIHDALKYSKFVKLYGATSVECHADFVFENCINNLPFSDAPELIDRLNEVIDEYHIDYIYPAHDSALKRLSDDRKTLHAEVVASPEKTVEICRSKNLTYTFLKDAPYLPAFYSSANDIPEFPVFIKPAVGQGSEGACLILDRQHLDEALFSGIEYSICEYLPGKEFTVDCFTDLHGKLRFINPRSRDRIRAGIAVRSHRLPCSDSIRSIAEDINSRMEFNGAWFFQLKENQSGEYRLMEVAPRIAGTMGLTRSLGVNLPLLTLYNFWGMETEIISNNNEVLLDRAFISRFHTDITYSNIYVDFDDTLILKDTVNAFLMMFLYQAHNQGKNLYLLTRHADDIYTDLDRFCIPQGLFSEIIHIDANGKKTDFIKSDSIFIDDSFSERKRVHDKCGIPVFDLDMIESLLDWRA
ncbi:MAG: ATP-grasp domain-containing protein [Eubacteriales bacterium]|nr:ATP-grasp domain-containing protein [Eubacteriales bacterium]